VDVVVLEVFLGLPERLVEAAEGRAAIAEMNPAVLRPAARSRSRWIIARRTRAWVPFR
jgi:hypothetical protein